MKSNKFLMVFVGGVVILSLVLLFSSLSGAAPSPNAAINVGFVDTGKIQNELPDYQSLQAILKEKDTEFKLYQGYIMQQHRNALKELQDKAVAEKNGKTAEEQASIDKRYKDEAQKKSDELNAQLEAKRNEIMQYLNEQKKLTEDKVKKLITEVGAEKKLSMVLDKSVVFYGGTDITDLVIEKAKKEANANSKKK
ncbi:MAG TPA: OmpH family outer membrane protein [Bacillota bacterium]|nr:OmpH family outer membrane protein [Bacillota bacterium]HOL09421.1 OmpH family outer membrane protein [Bacillota bacterium]HPO97145.1 OmpH family outer membrane protein [Bacillota bacterium]